MTQLQLTDSQKWLLLYALKWLTTDEGADRLYSEYPNMDIDALGADLGLVLDQLAGNRPPTIPPNRSESK